MDMDLVQVISQVGFPIAVACWFMYTGHKDSVNVTEAMHAMANAVEANTKAIENMTTKGA